MLRRFWPALFSKLIIKNYAPRVRNVRQEDIASQLEESPDVSIDTNEYSLSSEIKEIIVASNGLIALQGGKAGQMFMLIPSVANSTVTWRYVGGTHEYMPMKCRNT